MVVMALFFLQELQQLDHVWPQIHQIRTLTLTPCPEAARWYRYRSLVREYSRRLEIAELACGIASIFMTCLHYLAIPHSSGLIGTESQGE